MNAQTLYTEFQFIGLQINTLAGIYHVTTYQWNKAVRSNIYVFSLLVSWSM